MFYVNKTPEQMIEDLTAAGWRKKLPHTWANPAGKLFVGPAGAWKVMMGISNGCEVLVSTVTSRP